MGADKQVSWDHVQACTGQSGAQGMDDLIYNTGGGRAPEAFRAYHTLIEEECLLSPSWRALQNHFRRLIWPMRWSVRASY